MKQNAQNGPLPSRTRRLRLVSEFEPGNDGGVPGEVAERPSIASAGNGSLVRGPRPAPHRAPHRSRATREGLGGASRCDVRGTAGPGQDHPLSVATVHRVHATLHCALNGAVKQGVIERNPASLVELPAVMRARTAPWSAGELATFLDSTVDDPMHALFALLGLRGLRRGEALGLRWRNVDLDKREIHIEEQLTFYNGVVVFGPPKSKSGRRLVAIDETLARNAVAARAVGEAQTAKINGWQSRTTRMCSPTSTAIP